jgi:phage shock protein PspC (stress-responsive transcriptional regulator)
MTKRLYRSTTDKKIAGVCGGLAEYTNSDPTIWRVLFLLLLLPGGIPGPLVYIIMWITVPEKPKADHKNIVDA